jgi:hypothetical protein
MNDTYELHWHRGEQGEYVSYQGGYKITQDDRPRTKSYRRWCLTGWQASGFAGPLFYRTLKDAKAKAESFYNFRMAKKRAKLANREKGRRVAKALQNGEPWSEELGVSQATYWGAKFRLAPELYECEDPSGVLHMAIEELLDTLEGVKLPPRAYYLLRNIQAAAELIDRGPVDERHSSEMPDWLLNT